MLKRSMPTSTQKSLKITHFRIHYTEENEDLEVPPTSLR
jgi:hypothetical protein